jgi:hypothetical protein
MILLAGEPNVRIDIDGLEPTINIYAQFAALQTKIAEAL